MPATDWASPLPADALSAAKDKAGDIADKVKGVTGNLMDKGGDIADKVKETLKDKGGDLLDSLADKAHDLADKLHS